MENRQMTAITEIPNGRETAIKMKERITAAQMQVAAEIAPLLVTCYLARCDQSSDLDITVKLPEQVKISPLAMKHYYQPAVHEEIRRILLDKSWKVKWSDNCYATLTPLNP
jgi:hypothetical protein